MEGMKGMRFRDPAPTHPWAWGLVQRAAKGAFKGAYGRPLNRRRVATAPRKARPQAQCGACFYPLYPLHPC
jgi:hypothetical protein